MSENTERCVCCAGPGPCITVDRNQGKTPSPLTREQVEEQLENIHLGSVDVRVKSMACIRKHDAALRLTLAQQAQRIQELEDQRIRYGPICLNCGKDKPCMTEAEANQHGASIPCIFDPAPKELWQRCKQQAQEIERLVKDAKGQEVRIQALRKYLAQAITEHHNAEIKLAAMSAELTAARNAALKEGIRSGELVTQLAASQARVRELEEVVRKKAQDFIKPIIEAGMIRCIINGEVLELCETAEIGTRHQLATLQATLAEREREITALQAVMADRERRLVLDMEQDMIAIKADAWDQKQTVMKERDAAVQEAGRLREALSACVASLSVYVNGGNPSSPYKDGANPCYVMGSHEALDQAQRALKGEGGQGDTPPG